MSVREDKAVDLVLDVLDDHARLAHHTGHVDLVVEVANIAHDGLVLHLSHIAGHDDAKVASGGDEDVGSLDNA